MEKMKKLPFRDMFPANLFVNRTHWKHLFIAKTAMENDDKTYRFENETYFLDEKQKKAIKRIWSNNSPIFLAVILFTYNLFFRSLLERWVHSWIGFSLDIIVYLIIIFWVYYPLSAALFIKRAKQLQNH